MKNNSKKPSKKIVFLAVAAIGIPLIIYAVSTAIGKINLPSQQEKINDTDSTTSASNYDDQTMQIVSHGDYSWDLNNPYYFYENTPTTAIVYIDSIDEMTTYSKAYDEYIHAHTYGTMTIRDSFKENIQQGEKVKFARIGGKVTFDDYYKSMNKEQQDKYNYLSKGEKSPEYVEMFFADDIRIEAGKTYVAFLTPQSYKDRSSIQYIMEGGQYGLREIKNYNAETKSETLTLNNTTNEWEPLSNIVPLKSK